MPHTAHGMPRSSHPGILKPGTALGLRSGAVVGIFMNQNPVGEEKGCACIHVTAEASNRRVSSAEPCNIQAGGLVLAGKEN